VLKYPKRFTKDQKASILSEYAKEGLSISEFSRKYQVSAYTIYKWRNARNAMKEQQATKIMGKSPKWITGNCRAFETSCSY